MDAGKLLEEVFKELLIGVRANPELNSRLEKIVEKYASGTEKPTGRTHRRKRGVFDPMAIYRENPGNLESKLAQLSIDELKDIIAEHGMDRSKLAMKWKTKNRLVNLILTTVESRMRKGDAFRIFPSSPDQPKADKGGIETKNPRVL